MDCRKCGVPISPGKLAKCSICSGVFHPACTRLKSASSFKKLRKDLREKWKCDTCVVTRTFSPTGSRKETSSDSEDEFEDPNPEDPTSDDLNKLNRNMNILMRKFDKFGEKFISMETTMGFFNEQYEEMKKSLQRVESQITEVMKQNTSLAEENKKLKKDVTDISRRTDDLEQALLSSTVEIKGIPFTTNEDPGEVVKILAEKLQIPEADRAFESAFRVFGPRNPASIRRQNEMIIMKLQNVLQKKSWFSSIRKKKDISARDLYSTLGDSKIYINERLTFRTNKLFWLSRKVGREYGYKFVWVSDGRIFMKKEEGDSRSTRIVDLDQLRKIDNKNAISELYT
uniref:MADS-box transcription factor 22 n=1 Tax=Lygus hesperus TaxID=30085 RepID=A0A0A9YDX5_LYGHE